MCKFSREMNHAVQNVWANTNGPLLFTCFGGRRKCGVWWAIMPRFQGPARPAWGYHFDFPNSAATSDCREAVQRGIISDGVAYEPHLPKSSSSLRTYLPYELVKRTSQWGFHFDSPNLQDSCNMPLSWMVYYMGYIGKNGIILNGIAYVNRIGQNLHAR